MDKQKFTLPLNGKELGVEIENLAEQSNGSCFLRYGDTEVLTTAVMSKEEKEGQGFFPLTVEYEERYYAAGKIKGSRYMKREGRPSDEAICNARLIDRAVRPLFPDNLAREVQIINTVLSWDGQNDPDVLSLISSSLAVLISDIPWQGPVAAIRIARVDDKFLLNPTYEEKEKSQLDFVLSAVPQKEGSDELLINMMEGGFEEVEEKLILEMVDFAKPYLKKLIDFQLEIAKKIGKEKLSLPPKANIELEKEIKKFLGNKLETAMFQKTKGERIDKIEQLKKELFDTLKERSAEDTGYAEAFFDKEFTRTLHETIIQKGVRPDGRKPDEIREIYCEAGFLPRTHGSGVFCRGQTKALSILTLGRAWRRPVAGRNGDSGEKEIHAPL